MGLISNGTTVFDNGSMASGFGGSMVFIKKLTASASATLSFVDGTDGVVLDDTYKEYYITFNNIHAATDNVNFTFNMSTDGGSNYNVTKTTTFFRAYHDEADTGAIVGYEGSFDFAQSTSFATITSQNGNGADESSAGSLTLFNPSSTTHVKHFISNNSNLIYLDYAFNNFMAGYGNTTSAINAVQFKMTSGNFDGDICLYGIA
jgi:hypothetical protein